LFAAGTKINSDSVATLCKYLVNLLELDLSKCPNLLDTSLFLSLAQLEHLQWLSLESSGLSGSFDVPRSDGPIRPFKLLRFLNLASTAVSNDDLRKMVSSFSELTDLILTDCDNCSADGLAWVLKCTFYLICF
jgi:hypothetical protein